VQVQIRSAGRTLGRLGREEQLAGTSTSTQGFILVYHPIAVVRLCWLGYSLGQRHIRKPAHLGDCKSTSVVKFEVV